MKLILIKRSIRKYNPIDRTRNEYVPNDFCMSYSISIASIFIFPLRFHTIKVVNHLDKIYAYTMKSNIKSIIHFLLSFDSLTQLHHM